MTNTTMTESELVSGRGAVHKFDGLSAAEERAAKLNVSFETLHRNDLHGSYRRETLRLVRRHPIAAISAVGIVSGVIFGVIGLVIGLGQNQNRAKTQNPS